MANEPITGLPYQEANMLQTDVLQNEQLNYFAAWFGTVVQTVGDTAPPGSPVNGHCYIIGASATGAWAGKDKYLTVYRDGWQFYAPKEGVRITNLDDGKIWTYSAGDWSEYSIPVSADAASTSYDNSTSGLAATDVQAAIDELAAGADGIVIVNTPANSSGTVTLDFASKSKYIGAITLGANVTTLAFSNLPGAGKYAEYELHVKQDPTTPRTFALPASHKALGGSDTAIAAGVGVTTVLTASTIDNGTTWRYAMQESA